MELYTVYQISIITGIPIKTVYTRIKSLGVEPESKKQNENLYNKEQVDIIKNGGVIVKYVPFYHSEQFYIYESKMNTNG